MTAVRTVLEEMVALVLRGHDLARQDLAKEIPPIAVLTMKIRSPVEEHFVAAGDDTSLAWVQVYACQQLSQDILPLLTPAERADLRKAHGRAVLGWMDGVELGTIDRSLAAPRKPQPYPVTKFKRRWNVEVRQGPPITATVEKHVFTLREGHIALVRRIGPGDAQLYEQARVVCDEALRAAHRKASR